MLRRVGELGVLGLVVLFATASASAESRVDQRSAADLAQRPGLYTLTLGNAIWHPETSRGNADKEQQPKQEAAGNVVRLPQLSPNGDSADGGAPTAPARLTGFPSSRNGPQRFTHGRWLHDDRQGMNGVMVGLPASTERDGDLVVGSTFVDRSQGNAGASQGHDRDGVWALTVDGRPVGDNLQLHGEYATSEQSTDDGRVCRGAASGQAYALGAKITGEPARLGGRQLNWAVNVDRRQVDANFWSLADDATARGKLLQEMTGNASWGAMAADLRYRRISDIDSDSQDRATALEAAVDYGGAIAQWMPTLWDTLANPHYRLEVSRYTAMNGGARELSVTRRLAFSANFAPATFNWHLDQSYAWTDPPDGASASRQRHTTLLGVNVPLGQRARLAPDLRWHVVRDAASDIQSARLSGALGSSAELIHNRLAADIKLTADRYFTGAPGGDSRGVGLSSSLRWVLRGWKPDQPHLQLSLDSRFRYRTGEDESGGRTTIREAYAGVSLSWPAPP